MNLALGEANTMCLVYVSDKLEDFVRLLAVK